jgi:hypothetical protein
MTTWVCLRCEAQNRGRTCEACGWERVAVAAPAVWHCPADGAPLRENGWCTSGRGYALSAKCPFACPLCRQPLHWSGGCPHCHGCTTGDREDWTYPGDRWEVDDESKHWRRVLVGARPATTKAEVAQHRAENRRRLAPLFTDERVIFASLFTDRRVIAISRSCALPVAYAMVAA